jgi:UDP-N-acetylmuramyl pentapeptide phosphotransferase/UDP-N-acetylglucosamine-1-phosphate transferase
MTSIKVVFIVMIILAVNAVLTRILLRTISPFLLARGIYGYDVNKPAMTKVPEEGGVSIAVALVFSLLLYGYFFNLAWVSLLAITTALISLIGFVDRLRDIRPYPKFFYCAVAGSLYGISFLQDPNVGLYHALLFLFLGSVAYSVVVNSFNLLAGFNGLESGLAVISSLAQPASHFCK